MKHKMAVDRFQEEFLSNPPEQLSTWPRLLEMGCCWASADGWRKSDGHWKASLKSRSVALVASPQ